MLQAFKDAAVVAGDFADVAAQFTNAPAAVLKLGKDAISAVLHRDPVALAAVVAEADQVFATVQADGVQAGPAIQTLQTDLKQFLADLS
jgi:hypothetical protein